MKKAHLVPKTWDEEEGTRLHSNEVKSKTKKWIKNQLARRESRNKKETERCMVSI